MKRFDDNLINFILNNILIQDLAENIYNLEKNKKKSTKSYPVYNYVGEKIIVNANKNTFFTSNYQGKGSVIDFVKYIENTDFVNAVKKIASYTKTKINSI